MIDFSPESIDRMLELADCESGGEGSKRRDAYVTEWYFEHRIVSQVSDGLVSTGWCYFDRNKVRYWFKVLEDAYKSDSQRKLDREIIVALKKIDRQQRFFSVFEYGGFIRLREIVIDAGCWIQTSALNMEGVCDLQGMNDEAFGLLGRQSGNPEFIAQWMLKTSESYRKKLLLQRLLLNVGIREYYPADVDAIEIRDHEVVFHEFKRKTICPNGCFTFVNARALKRFPLLKVRKKCEESNPMDDQELFRFVESESVGGKRIEGSQCYGLDMSHLNNYEFCEKNGIRFVHTIWDSGNYPKKPRIDALFDESLEPKDGVALVSLDLVRESFVGFTFTHGGNSGSYSKDLRIQVAMDAAQFCQVGN